jgi:hypothetical protein
VTDVPTAPLIGVKAVIFGDAASAGAAPNANPEVTTHTTVTVPHTERNDIDRLLPGPQARSPNAGLHGWRWEK